LDLRFLNESDFPAIYETFRAAFEDYTVPIQVDADRLRGLMSRRGARFEFSVGAFDGGKMVAVMATAVREFEDIYSAYDVFTGVIPGFRGQGLAGRMFDRARPALVESGVRRFLLEVIDSNAPAIRAYERAGFVTRRRFQCRALESVAERSGPAGLEWTTVEAPDWPTWSKFADREDSWQNSRASIAAVLPEAICLVARSGGATIGAAVVVPPARDLPWYGVDRRWRRRGVGTALLHRALALLDGTGPLRIINVDAESAGELAFLARHGARDLPSQLEMVLDLRG
jgi:ribosomal protein S18 acetylase RimI-like enzyme